VDLTKPGLHDAADGLLLEDPAAVAECLKFFLDESRGYWHNRARAMIARRLKHCSTTVDQRSSAIDCILNRLETGNFSEQFRDQLRLALHWNSHRAIAAARGLAANSPKPHVRRFAEWIVRRHP